MPRTRRATPDVAPAAETRNGGDVNAAKRSDKETVVTLRLPRDLHDRLKKAGGARGLTAQIRQRLERSFTPGPFDPKTGQLLAGVSYIANALALDGKWHEDPYLFQVLKAGVLTLLSRFEPVGDPAQRHPTSSYVMLSPEDGPPDTAGRMLAGLAFRDVTKE
jgi:hypothetical protein